MKLYVDALLVCDKCGTEVPGVACLELRQGVLRLGWPRLEDPDAGKADNEGPGGARFLCAGCVKLEKRGK